MICIIDTASDHSRVFRYVLQEHKRATILETNIAGASLNRVIIDRERITKENSKPVLKQLMHPFSQMKKLLPHVKNSTVHIKIGFDPKDGEVPHNTKIAVAYRLLDSLGYDTTPKVIVDHHRDDPDHDKPHDHDHLHAISETRKYNFLHVHDSHNYARAKIALRTIEQDYGLTPFVAKAERDLQVCASPIIRPTFEVMPYEYEHEHQESALERMGR